jgi:hypothetical protein
MDIFGLYNLCFFTRLLVVEVVLGAFGGGAAQPLSSARPKKKKKSKKNLCASARESINECPQYSNGV